MADWLPLIMRRPELFTEGIMPDISQVDGPDLLLARSRAPYRQRQHSTSRNWSIQCYQANQDGPSSSEKALSKSKDWSETAGEACWNAADLSLTSIPIYVWTHIFRVEPLPPIWRNHSILLGRSLLCVQGSRDPHPPAAQLKDLDWHRYADQPWIQSQDPSLPVQVVVPCEPPHLSGHQRMDLEDRIEADLALIGHIFHWGQPAAPVTLNLPDFETSS